MQALAIGLAASLLIGPAPLDPGASEPPEVADNEQPEVADTEQPEVADTEQPEVADTEDPVVQPEAEPAQPEPAPAESPQAVESPQTVEPPAPTGEAELEAATASAPPAPVTRDRLGCAGSKPCRKMTVVGIVVGTLGLAAVGTGVGLLVKPDEVLPESPAFVTSTRPAGLVTLTVGAGVTLTAVLMLVASHRGYKQRGEQARRVEPLVNGLRF